MILMAICSYVALLGSTLFAQTTDQASATDSVLNETDQIEQRTVLELRSDPIGATFLLNDTTLPDSLGNIVQVDSGNYKVEAFLDGFEPLSYEFDCTQGEEFIFNFILLSLPPEPQPPESLGLSYIPIKSFIDSSQADRQMSSYKSASEVFAIFPFGQGVMAKLFLGDSRGNEADIMIATGATLTLGSLILGKIFSSNNRSKIREENNRIMSKNESATLQNKDVEQTLKASERKRVSSWQASNLQRGRVSVVRR